MASQPTVKSRIPTFTSIEEEATFWDTHSTTEFEDEWEPAALEFARPLGHGVAVTFDVKTLDRIAALARARGVPAPELMRQWIVAALDVAESHPSDPDPTSSDAM